MTFNFEQLLTFAFHASYFFYFFVFQQEADVRDETNFFFFTTCSKVIIYYRYFLFLIPRIYIGLLKTIFFLIPSALFFFYFVSCVVLVNVILSERNTIIFKKASEYFSCTESTRRCFRKNSEIFTQTGRRSGSTNLIAYSAIFERSSC